MARRFRNRIHVWDVSLAVTSVVTMWYLIQGGEELADRSTLPMPMDIWMGIAFIVLVLEAARRSTGLIMPIVAVIFLGYALFGEALPPPWTHRNYEVDRLVGQLYITLAGLFAPALYVSCSLHIMFPLYGSLLTASRA